MPAEFGWDSGTPGFNWATLRDNKKTEISRLNAIYRNLLAGVDAEMIDGRGQDHRRPYSRRGRASIIAPTKS